MQFTALSFREPRNVHFRYRLEGYDSDWYDAGTRRSAFYTNLPPAGAQPFWSLLFLVTVFALGILLSMSLFGIVLAHMLSARRMTGRVAGFSAAATAIGSLALGVYWITGL